MKIELVQTFYNGDYGPGSIFSNKTVINIEDSLLNEENQEKINKNIHSKNNYIETIREFCDKNNEIKTISGKCLLTDFFSSMSNDEYVAEIIIGYIENVLDTVENFKEEFAENSTPNYTKSIIIVDGKEYNYGNSHDKEEYVKIANEIIDKTNGFYNISTNMLIKMFKNKPFFK